MSLEYVHLDKGAEPMESVTVDRHLYLTEDGEKVVEEGDPAGRWLWAAPGDLKPRKEAERLGAVKAEAKAKAEPKKRTPAANKMRGKAEDKSAEEA